MLNSPDAPATAAVHAVLAMTGLSAVFAVKHLVADFLLQTNGMARGKERRAGWLAPRLWWLAGVDFAIHMAVDRAKTAIARRPGVTPDQPRYWWLLGLDQCLHQLTNIGLAAAIMLL